MEIYGRKDEEVFEYWSLLQNMWLSLYTAKSPVIAQINGTCPAAGCLMAIAADYRIMEDNKKYKIGLNETQLGFAAPDWLCFNYRGLNSHFYFFPVVVVQILLARDWLNFISNLELFSARVRLFQLG